MRNSTELTINLGNLAHNYELLKKLTPNNETIFMVKANAYGHGLLEIVQFAFEELGVKEFGCASLGEAMQIRKHLPAIACQLYVFSDAELQNSDCRSHYVNYNILPVIHCLDDLKIVLADKELKYLPLVLKFDTGMHRLGILESEVASTIEILKRHGRTKIHHLLTHFANSYIKLKGGDKSVRQLEAFEKICSEFKGAGIAVENMSCANSGAIEQNFALDFSHVRPGLMLYGPAGTGDKKLWPAKNVSTFKTKVLKTMSIKKGTPIGYGGHVCGHDGHVIYLPIGYGDGFLTFFSGGKLKIFDQTAKVLGRVNMDLTALFFEELPAGIKAESDIFIWDDNEHDISELSTQMKTIPYQLFTGITTRVPRRYIK